jgi:hypothetical protein
MIRYLFFNVNKFKYRIFGILLLVGFLIFSDVSVNAQATFNRKTYRSGGSKGKGKIKFKRNVLWLEGLGSSQVVSVKYERILMFGSHFSMRVDLGVTPFVVDEKYNFIVGTSITPITGLGFYYHFNPSPIRIGVGCSALHDIFFQGIPETVTDSTGPNPSRTYRARVMPFAVVEATIKETLTIRAGYTPIIDPPNDGQTQLYFTHWATIGVGYKFGR